MSSVHPRNRTTGRISIWPLRRAAIRSLHPIAPGPAAHLAARWFVTPERRSASIPPGDEGTVAEPTSLVVRAGSEKLAAWSWGHGPLVLLVHGWSGHGLQLAAIARGLAARGHRAVAFDHPAHGRSTGRTATIPEMADAVAAVSGELGGARAVVAHSLGAVAATIAMSRGLEVDRAVFLAPPIDPVRWMHRFGRALGLPPSADASLVAAVEARAGAPVSAVRPIELAPALTAELLVVHDRADREVPFSDGKALAAAWPGARLVATDGLGHNRLLADPAAVALVADFIGDAPPARLRDPHMAAFAELAMGASAAG